MLGLYRKADSETGKWLRAFNGLPCLPPAMVPDAFAELMSEAPESSGLLHVFADSILSTYIETKRYPPSLWAREPCMDDPTTTNAAESFHSTYNSDLALVIPSKHSRHHTIIARPTRRNVHQRTHN
ncbi:hypothetical protein FOCC_FOCC015628 [Frankliniella occidentalis]|nr:hypothetical protein FOCC_FOCC015628 [Frankliniella occidentalis]